jgi:hypothetical protein
MYNDGTGVSIEAFQGNSAATKRNLWLAAYGGNVGIGTSSPSSRLTITGGTTEIRDGNYLMLRPVGNGWDMRLQATGTQLDVLSGGALGSPIMSLVNGGNVGIGISSPSARLDVAGNIFSRPGGATGAVAELTADASSGANGISLIAGFASGGFGPIRLLTSGTERMRIDSSGNVGIGTSSPGARLDVKGLVRSSIGTGTGAGGAGYAFYQFGTSATASENWHIGAEGDGSFRFYNQGFGAGLERMRIDASGNVGIGTNSPGVRLDVAGGAIRVGNTHSMQFRNAAGTGAAVFTLQSDDNFVVYNAAGTPIQSFTQGVNSFAVYGGNSNNRMLVDSGSNLIYWNVNGSERMRITSGGEVYIAGTTDQGAYNLQVNGTGVWGAGAYVNGSDRNLKEEVAPLADALDVVAALKPVTFRYKEDYSKDQSIQPGFIAQELQEALADQVYVDGVVQAGPKHLNVAYQSLIPVLVKALQEANEKIDTLAARVAQLEGN